MNYPSSRSTVYRFPTIICLLVFAIGCSDDDSVFESPAAEEMKVLHGTPSPIEEIVEFDGRLVSVGRFQRVGETRVTGPGLIIWNEGHGTIRTLPDDANISGISSISPVSDGFLVHGVSGGPETGFACWKGSSWASIPSPIQHSAVVTEYQDRLVIASNIPGTAAREILAWNGSEWTAVGALDSLFVEQLATHDGTLVAAGSNTGKAETDAPVAIWSGESWIRLPSLPDSNGSDWIERMHVHQNEIFVVDEISRRVARWTGDHWEPVELPKWWSIRAMASLGSELWISGHFEDGALLRYDNSGFSFAQPDGQPPEYAGELAVADGRLWVSGRIQDSNGREFQLARLDKDESWSFVDVTMNAYRVAGSGEDLAISGVTSFGGMPAGNIAMEDEKGWIALASETDGRLHAATPFGNDLIVGGSFESLGGESIRGVARWSGGTWHPIGDGFSRDVYDLHVHEGELYAAGSMPNGVARWDGTTWVAVGMTEPRRCTSLVTHDGNLFKTTQNGTWMLFGTDWWPIDETRGARKLASDGESLYAISDDRLVNGAVRRWDGRTWHEMTSDSRDVPLSIAIHTGIVYIGTFEGVFSWTGTEWTPLDGVPTTRGVRTLLPHGRSLLIGGEFHLEDRDGERIDAGILAFTPAP